MEPQDRAGPRQPPHCACSSGKRCDGLPLLPCIFRTAVRASQADRDDHESRVEPHETELNPHEAVPGGWPPRQLRSRAFLAGAVASARQLVRAETATPSPAVRGAQLATPAGSRPAAGPARAYLAWSRVRCS